MKKKIAIMAAVILTAGAFTACTAEKVKNDIQTSVVSTADVSASEESSEITAEKTTETEPTETTEKATVAEETEPASQDSKSKEKSGVGQSSADTAATEPTQAAKAEKAESKTATKTKSEANATKVTKNPTQPLTHKSTQKPTEKATQKPTQPPAKAKTVDVNSAVSDDIAYGKKLGMNYDSLLNTANASWFSPTNADYYDSTSELVKDIKIDVKYVADYYQSDGIKPCDISFNVLAENNKIYVVYC